MSKYHLDLSLCSIFM